MSLSIAVLSLAASAASSDPNDNTADVQPIPVEGVTLQEEDVNTDPAWTGAVLVGITDTTGNNTNFTAAVNAEAILERENDRFTLRGYMQKVEAEQLFDDDNNGLSDRKETVVTQRRVGISGQYDYLAGEKHYYFTKATASKDKQANIELRYYAGAGLGYDFRKSDEFSFTGEVGLSYFSEAYRNVAAGEDDEADSVALTLGYDLAYAFSEDTSLTQKYEAYPAVDDFHDVYMRLDTRLNTNLTKNMVGSLQYLLEYDNTPATNGSVEAPLDNRNERIDRVLAINVGWSFGR